MSNQFRGFHIASITAVDQLAYVMRITNGISGWTDDYRKAQRFESRKHAESVAALYRENGAEVSVVFGSPLHRSEQPSWMPSVFILLAIILMGLSLYAFLGLSTANVGIEGDLSLRLLYSLPVLGAISSILCLVIGARRG